MRRPGVEVRRGDLVTVSVSGDYGKPCPALILQSDAFNLHPSVTVLPLTSEIHDVPLFRILLLPEKQNGLQKPSQIMVDKTLTIPRSKLGKRIGHVDVATLRSVSHALQAFLGL